MGFAVLFLFKELRERGEGGPCVGLAGRRRRGAAERRISWRDGGIGVLVRAKGHGAIPDRQKLYDKILKNTINFRARIASR